jgi:AraC-like DNA-binding protein
MKMNQVDVLRLAAAPVMKRIQEDKERARQPVLVLLECLEANLFNPDCNVNSLKLWTGTRDNSVALLFHSDLGMTPKRYLEKCRMETAVRLLYDSDLDIWQVADLLGFSSLGVFSRAFQRWAGIRPSVVRVVSDQPVAEGPPRREGPSTPTSAYLCRVLTGQLAPEEARELIAHLLAIYPATCRYPVAA